MFLKIYFETKEAELGHLAFYSASLRSVLFRRPLYQVPRTGQGHGCSLLFIFLVGGQTNLEDGVAFAPAGGKAAACAGTIGPSLRASVRRPGAGSAHACWSILEPLLELEGLQPARLEFLQV
jgi:hypothetical protein